VRTTLAILLFVVMICASTPAKSQQPAKLPQIGYLSSSYRYSGTNPVERARGGLIEPFRQGLRELGYVEGQNFILQTRNSEERQLQAFANELAQLKVDVVVTQAPDSTYAAMKATSTIPIVMTFPGDAASEGFVASLERPGGNVTGVSGLIPELGGKWVELVKETIPSTRRVAVLWNPKSEALFPTRKSVEVSARILGVDVQWLEVRTRENVLAAFNSATSRHADAFIVLPGGIFFATMPEIVDFSLKSRLPGISWRGDFAEAGGLMAYGANRREQSRRAAHVVDKILKGAKPAELAMEVPRSFELVINLKTAKEIGVAISPEVLIWADRVIR
jgi:putative ABC transport system substrate-binding protein